MRAYVFTDPALASEAGRFVWLAMNTERPSSAPFLRRYPVPALPSYFVLDPTTQRVAVRWVGGASVAQLRRVLDDGRQTVLPPSTARRMPGTAQAADAAFAGAESLYAAGADSAAAEFYDRALRSAPESWPHFSRAVESMLFALTESGGNERAATLARDAFPRLARSASAGNVAASGLEAALELPDSSASRSAVVAALERDAEAVAVDRTVSIAADDRSSVYIALLDARKDAHDDAGAKHVAAEWTAFLEGEAARAATPDARAVFDSHRLSAYVELGQPERAIPMLEASERALPDDYNPPARLAVAYRAMKRWNDALAASDRALQKAYGPRKLGMLQVRTDIFLGLSDSTSARHTLEDAVSLAEGLPQGQRSERSIAALHKRLDSLH